MNTPDKISDLMLRASANDTTAQNSLGCAYHNGDGVQRDYATARLWFEKAAAGGNALAFSNLAILFERGLGVDKNISIAFDHRKKAAELGHTDSMNIIARAYRYGEEPVEKDLTEAFKWYKRSAEDGNIKAAETLGIFYDFGYGCERDYTSAVKWYLIAAKKGLSIAQNNLGSNYESGNGVVKDYKQAFYWYKKAAEQGNEYAQCNLGILYLEGKGTSVSKKYAYLWLKKSADNNHDRAKKMLQKMIDDGYNPDKDKTVLSNDIISKNPFRILGVYINASTRDIQANKTKINAFINVGNNPDFPSDHLMMEENCPALYNEDNEPIYVPRDERSVNTALAAINMPLDKIKYALFWFANVTPIDEIALNHISDTINIDEATELWDKKETFSALLNKGLMNLCAGNIEDAIINYSVLLHNESFRNDFLHIVVGDNFTISEDELSHLFIDSLLEYFPNEDWRTVFLENGGYWDDDDYITEKLSAAPIKNIEDAITEAMSVDKKSALSSYNASKKLQDTTRSALCELNELMDISSAQYQMLVDKLANQILQTSINYYNNSNDEESAFKAIELQRYAQSIAVGKMAKDRCAQNINILQGIIDKLPPAEIRQAVNFIHSNIRYYSEKAKNNSKQTVNTELDTDIERILGSLGPRITPVSPMIEELIEKIVFIREKMGANSKEYRSIVTDISVVALGITIDNVNNSQKGNSPYGALLHSPNIREALVDAVKVVQYIELMGPERKFLTERLAPNKNTLDRMASSYAISAHVDSRTFLTEAEYYNCSHSKSELNDFIKRYPNGAHSQDAKSKIEKISLLESELAKFTTIEECQSLFNSRHRDNVCDGLIDDKCFSLVKKREKDCRKYLETFSKHSKEVKGKLKTIHKWWWALGIVNTTLLGCLLIPEMIAIPIVAGVVGLIIDACV